MKDKDDDKGVINPKKDEVPHPKNDEELQEILDKTKEFGGGKKGTIKHGDWSLDGKAVDF